MGLPIENTVARTPRTGRTAAATDAPAAPGDDQQERQLREHEFIALQQDRYDFAAEERAELLREYDATLTAALTQLKFEDSVLQKYIAMI